MKIRIYQINIERDAKRVVFVGTELLEKYQGSAEVDSTLYDKVFEGEVDCAGLEGVFRIFNLEHPEGYTGRSLSVSDVVEVIDGAGNSTFHFCDSFGFKQIPFQPELAGGGAQAASLSSNAYFLNMKAVSAAWEQARDEREKRKSEIIQTYGWESEELQQWYAEDRAAVFPFTRGQSKAYRAWANSLYHGSSDLECDDLPWEKDTVDFVSALREAGFTTLVVTDQSTALMESLHRLAALGCTPTGLCQITRQETRWGDEGPVTVNGIRFVLNEDAIYTHDEAADILEMFEDILERYDISVPSPEDDERGEDNGAKLYGSVYYDLLGDVEDALVALLEKHTPSTQIIQGEFSGR